MTRQQLDTLISDLAQGCYETALANGQSSWCGGDIEKKFAWEFAGSNVRAFRRARRQFRTRINAALPVCWSTTINGARLNPTQIGS